MGKKSEVERVIAELDKEIDALTETKKWLLNAQYGAAKKNTVRKRKTAADEQPMPMGVNRG